MKEVFFKDTDLYIRCPNSGKTYVSKMGSGVIVNEAGKPYRFQGMVKKKIRNWIGSGLIHPDFYEDVLGIFAY